MTNALVKNSVKMSKDQGKPQFEDIIVTFSSPLESKCLDSPQLRVHTCKQEKKKKKSPAVRIEILML